MPKHISEPRMTYKVDSFSRIIHDDHPIRIFEEWYDAAEKAAIDEPNAMTLATADAEGRPSARMVLLKAFDESGFVFYTNYDSRKGLQLKQNPYAALVFWWQILFRQVRIEGRVEKISAAESDAYFQSRPRGHRIGALASNQSEPVPDNSFLEKRFKELSDEYGDREIPRPVYWGGYRLIPDMIEFWQGKPNRLHHRIRFRKESTEKWKMDQLSP